MKFPLLTNRQIKLLLFFLIHFITAPPLAHSQFCFADSNCLDVGNYTTNSTYQLNLLSLSFASLTNQASLPSFGYSFTGEGSHKVYRLYNCRGDLNSQQCYDCVKEAEEEITERCPSQKESIIWFEECMLWYANRPLFSLKEENPYTWGYNGMFNDESTPHLIYTVGKNIDGSIQQAAYNQTAQGFAAGRASIEPLEDVYFLVQCTPDIVGVLCEKCLRAAFTDMHEYGDLAKSTAMMMFYPSCHIRYDREPILLNEAKYSESVQSLPISASPPSDSLLPPPASLGLIDVYWAKCTGMLDNGLCD